MLEIVIPGQELFNEETNEFTYGPSARLKLEHSLISISKWESKWHKPFLSEDVRTPEENLDYIRCMTVSRDVDPNIYYGITEEIAKEIDAYIEDKKTATWFSEKSGPPNRDVITSEVIYYQMIALNIPFECERWHLNRLLTLIRVCNIKNSVGKKMSKKDLYARNRTINEARRKQYGTTG